MSRKEERKASRVAKKQRKNEYYQNRNRPGRTTQDAPKTGNASGPAKKTQPSSGRVSQIQPPRQHLLKSHAPTPASTSVSSNKRPHSQQSLAESDEEIFSESDAHQSEEEGEEDVFISEAEADDDSFMTMIDQAFASGKLTKKGLVEKDSIKKSLAKRDRSTVAKTDESDEEDFEDDDLLSSPESGSEGARDDEVPRKQETNKKKAESIHVAPVAGHETRPMGSVSFATDEDAVKLLKRIQSLANKLSASNLIPIANELEGLLRDHRRKVVIELFTSTVIGSIVKPGGNLLDSFALNFAAISYIVYHIAGVEFGAHLVERLVETIDELYDRVKSTGAVESESAVDTDGTRLGETEERGSLERSLVNCMNFCSFLYDLQLISSSLICDLIRRSAERLEEVDVEMILKLFKTCGMQIKRDDPDFMKTISAEMNQRVAQLPKAQQTSRLRFMMETIGDLKDSKRKLASAMAVELEPIKKMLKNFLAQKVVSKLEPLRITLDDIHNIKTKGKWWRLGSPWHPDSKPSSLHPAEDNRALVSLREQNAELAKVERLAKEQRMNTEVRRAIFSALMTSDDYMDAFERLIGMKLTGRQERDIVLVLIHCCGQERQFNPFYAQLAGKLVSYRQSFTVTLQYTLWDCLKQMGDYPLRKLANIAKLYGMLIGQQCLPLAVLRKATFVRLGDREQIFWQLLFMTVFTRVFSDDELASIGQTLTDAIETGVATSADSSTKPDKDDRKRVRMLTKNLDMTEFDDDFFASRGNGAVAGPRTMSPEKLEECKSLQSGLILFLDTHFVKCSEFPFADGVDLCRRRARLMKRSLGQE